MRNRKYLLLCIVLVFFVATGCDSGSSPPPGDEDGDISVADGDEEPDVEYTEEEDGVDGDKEPEGDISDEEVTEAEETDGDVEDMEDLENDIESADETETEQEEAAPAAAPRFTGFTASGGTASSEDYRLLFRLAPAVMTVQAGNDSYHLNATLSTPAN